MNDGYIITYTGNKIYPLDLDVSKIQLWDIAHALSNKCRFSGHTKKFYSVAEHCILLAQNDFPGLAVWRLFHDAAEAYLPDIPTPIKQSIPTLVEAENKIISLVEKRFKLPKLNDKLKADIKKGDIAIRYWEGRTLMPLHPDSEWYPELGIPEIKIHCWGPKEAEDRFVGLACELLTKNILDEVYDSDYR